MLSPLLAPHLLFAFLLSLSCVYALKSFCNRYGYLSDVPIGRKQHTAPTPSVGGLAFVSVYLGVAAFALGPAATSLWSFFLPVIVLTLMGVADDGMDLKPLIKLAVQLGALAVAFHFSLTFVKFAGWLGATSLLLPFVVQPVLVVAAGFFVNAFNMTDGVDGLAGSLAVVMLLVLALVGSMVGSTLHVELALLLAAAVGGFLWWNLRAPWRKQALVFMGDAGSLMLGFSLVWLVATLTEAPSVTLWLAPWLLGYPLLDAIFVATRRMLKGHSPLKADRTHFHHLMLLYGKSTQQIVLLACAVALFYATIGVVLWVVNASNLVQALALLGGATLYFGAMAVLWQKQVSQ